MKPKTTFSITLIGIIIFSCSNMGSNVTTENREIADTELSYRNSHLMIADSTPGAEFISSEPGDGVRLQRAFENAPPMIPHNAEDYLPITIGENACLNCHHPDEAEDAEATPVSKTHFFDYRTQTQLTELNGANFNCTLCHAPQSTAPILIGNSFNPEYRAGKGESSSNLYDVLNEGVK